MRPDWDRPFDPSSGIEPFDLVVDVAGNAEVAAAFASQGLRGFAEADVEVEGIARVVDSVARSPCWRMAIARCGSRVDRQER